MYSMLVMRDLDMCCDPCFSLLKWHSKRNIKRPNHHWTCKPQDPAARVPHEERKKDKFMPLGIMTEASVPRSSLRLLF